MPKRSMFSVLLVALAVTVASTTAFAGDGAPKISIRNQQFTPAQLTVPANTKVELLVVNEDGLPAEFESYDLSREVVVPGHSQVRIFIGPLDPGKYGFFNDFHQQSKGWIVVRHPAAD